MSVLMLRGAVVASLFLSSGIARGLEHVESRTDQVLSDLCVLNIYMSGQARFVNLSSTVADTLIDSQSPIYPEHSQARYSFLDYTEGFAKVLYFDKAVVKFTEFFSTLASDDVTSYYNLDLCSVESVVDSGWLQHYVDRPTFAELIPQLKKSIGTIRGTTNDAVAHNVEEALRKYARAAHRKNAQSLHGLSLQGEKLMQDYRKNGVPDRLGEGKPIPFDFELAEDEISSMLLQLKNIARIEKNPLYWRGSFYTGIVVPMTLKPWKLHASPLSELQDTYDEGLEHIRAGDFRTWWTQMRSQIWEQ